MFIISSYKSIQNKEFLEALEHELSLNDGISRELKLGLNEEKSPVLKLGLNSTNSGELKNKHKKI